MLENARLKVLASHQGSSQKEMLTALEKEAIKTSLANLRTFPFLAEQEAKGRLGLHGAHFDIGTGMLTALNETTGQYYAL